MLTIFVSRRKQGIITADGLNMIVRRAYVLHGKKLRFLQEQFERFHHAAIYIGCGLCISVYGAGGDLEIATLQDMKRSFKTNQVVVATPKAVH